MEADAQRPVEPCRRDILAAALAAMLVSPAAAAGKDSVGLVVGGYAREGNSGLLSLGYRPSFGRWTRGTPIVDAPDASFGVYNSRLDLLYVVEEGAIGMIAVLRRGADGRWRRLARLPSLGADPCHLALDPSGLLLAVANYSSGSIALFRLNPLSGLPEGAGEQRIHQGIGPVPGRQLGPHAHWVGFTAKGRWLHAVDLGADTVFAHPVDPHTGRFGEAIIAFKAQPGAGPRHLARHPTMPYAYLVNELANSVTTLRKVGEEQFQGLGTISSLPPGFSGRNAAAEIAINRAGTRLYVSNRGHDSIAVFAVESDGALRLMQHVPSGGRTPRHFLLLEAEGRAIVANEGSGTVVAFRIGTDGRLSPQDSSIAVPGVTFIARVRA